MEEEKVGWIREVRLNQKQRSRVEGTALMSSRAITKISIDRSALWAQMKM